jgi:hypothetical protein
MGRFNLISAAPVAGVDAVSTKLDERSAMKASGPYPEGMLSAGGSWKTGNMLSDKNLWLDPASLRLESDFRSEPRARMQQPCRGWPPQRHLVIPDVHEFFL